MQNKTYAGKIVSFDIDKSVGIIQIDGDNGFPSRFINITAVKLASFGVNVLDKAKLKRLKLNFEIELYGEITS